MEVITQERSATSKIPGTRLALHLGCGQIKIPKFLNVDICPELPTVDVVDDIAKLSRFYDDSAMVIYACHVLEHFGNDEVIPVLTRWFEVLMPGGEIRISVPDIDRIVRIYHANWQHFQTPGNSPWIGLLYGGQHDEYDYHKTGFNFCWLKHLMEQVGFEDISEYPHEPHWLRQEDASMATLPFGEYISLNIRGKKPVRN